MSIPRFRKCLLNALSGLLFMSTSARATPPDMICTNINNAAGFQVRLVTGSSGLNIHNISPLSIYHSRIELPPAFIKKGPESFPLYPEENLKGQWLRDGHIDLHLYKEIKQADNKILSLDLVIKTKSTGKRDKDSGHLVHDGFYTLKVFSGSLQKQSGQLVKTVRGKAGCR